MPHGCVFHSIEQQVIAKGTPATAPFPRLPLRSPIKLVSTHHDAVSCVFPTLFIPSNILRAKEQTNGYANSTFSYPPLPQRRSPPARVVAFIALLVDRCQNAGTI